MTVAKLKGISSMAVWEELGLESTMKSVEYHRKLGQNPPASLEDRVISSAPESVRAVLVELRERLVELDSGHVSYQRELKKLNRPWATSFAIRFAGKQPSDYPYPCQYLHALETALVEPYCRIQSGEYESAAHAIASSELLRTVVSSAALDALKHVRSQEHFIFVQWSIALEIALSLLAASIVSSLSERSSKFQTDLTYILAHEGELPERTPLQAFCDVLMRDACCASQVAFVNHLMGKGVSVELRTLQRWCAGDTSPDETLVRLIAPVVRQSAPHEILDLYDVARYVGLLGHTSGLLLEQLLPVMDEPGATEAVAPWPEFPFNCASFGDWLHLRYPVWLAYHGDLVASGANLEDFAGRTLVG
ncbi:MAG: hypothetical protein FHP94_03215 [Denitromonas halophila]|nr:MAG: hypothetical protein FHP94_03215 [Denitromonas halophila]